MGLRETQALLARLYTDARFRRGFFDAPTQTALRFGLAEAEAGTIARIDRREVEDFARSLLGKRALDTRKALPSTAKALGADFDRLLFEALDGPPGRQGRRADAESFAELLAARSGAPGEPVWIADLARYELAFVDAARSGFFFRLQRFAYPVDEITRAIKSDAPVMAARQPRLGLWLRAPGGKLFWRLF
jgi:hypothetical protein